MKNRFQSYLRMPLILLFLWLAMDLFSCTIIAVGKKVSADGSVIISHTDCGADCRIRVVQGQSFSKGEKAPVHWGIQDIHRPINDFGDVIGTSALEATAFIGQLMSKYGFLPSCVGESETLVIGDTREIWILEVFSEGPGWDQLTGKPGAIWVAKRVPEDHALVVANWSIIKEVDVESF